jgi:diacylglycerol kinase (ATP)
MDAEKPPTRLIVALREHARLAWARANQPQVRRVAHTSARTGIAAARALRWRRSVRRAGRLVRAATRRRLIGVWRIVFYVLPLAPLRRRALEHLAAGVTLRRPRSPRGAPPRARVIANPYSGTMLIPGMLEDLSEAVQYLCDSGLPVELCLTERPGHATELARQAVQAGMEMVIAAGGDGTINDIVQALAGHPTALGVLPLGSVNVWAHEVNIPCTPTGAADVLLHGVRRRVDLGRAGDRYFLLMAGIGFDAEVARRVEMGRLKRIGLKVLDYAAVAGLLTVTQRPAKLFIRQEHRRRATRSLMVIVGNTRLYGGAMTFTGRAVADDGLLDVIVVGGGNVFYRAGVLLRAALRRPSLGPHVAYSRCRSLHLESDIPLPVQVDGEVVGTLPLTFSVATQALTVIVPDHAPSELFSCPPLAPTGEAHRHSSIAPPPNPRRRVSRPASPPCANSPASHVVPAG